jgi:hypothetical protein
MIFESVIKTFDSITKIFDTITMTFESSIKIFDAAITKIFDAADDMIFDPAVVMIFDHVCINLDHVAPDKAKFFSTKSQLIFTCATPDPRGLRLKDMHLPTLRGFDEGLWQSTTSN